MIFLRLFYVFSYIGLFNFGGGYAMLSFIQQEVVQKNGWMTEAEFTDIVAISQSTPGPIGINCATYVGYTAVMNDAFVADGILAELGLGWLWGIIGSLLATISVLWLPFIVMIMVSRFLLRHHDSTTQKSIFAVLRPAIIGLLASAALSLMNTSNFGSWSDNPTQFGISTAIFAAVFVGMMKRRLNIIYTTLACGLLGIVLYGIIGL
ncbi:MAG: chromate transporter [Bacteroidales bacterium]|jgi:chromate transporter|nr:chromate transporter [Bacteroidales bacterium]